jgi:hypothetical protein
MRTLPIDPATCTFIDYTAREGKALLIAADLPFAQIIGVEPSRRLANLAAQSCEKHDSASQRCKIFEIVHEDAVQFTPPSGNLVCFFFNPLPQLGREVAFRKLDLAAQSRSGIIYIVLTNGYLIRDPGLYTKVLSSFSLLVENRYSTVLRSSGLA